MINKTHILLENEVPKLVEEIIKKLDDYKIILLNGEIGSGKTFLTKEIAKQLGEQKIVTSPSFQIMNVYDKFIHIDAYNLKTGLEQYYDFFEDKILILEWSQKIKIKFNNYLEINIGYTSNEEKRIYEIKEVK